MKVAADRCSRCRLFQYGLNTGGPGVMSVGWIIVNFFSPLPRDEQVNFVNSMMQLCLLPLVWPKLSLPFLPAAVHISGLPY